MKRKLVIVDQTLRDGQQQPYVNFSIEQQKIIAKGLRECGADFIDVMPIVHESEYNFAKIMIDEGYTFIPTTLRSKMEVDHSLSLSPKGVFLFTPTSSKLIDLKQLDGSIGQKGLEKNITSSLELASYSRLEGEQMYEDFTVFFVAEDASRADVSYLLELANALEDTVDYFILADTCGVLDKESSYGLVSQFTDLKFDVGIHAHNDLGKAEEVTIAAVCAGANLVTGTVNGIGERAGNADLYKVLLELRSLGYATGVDLDNLASVNTLVNKFAGRCRNAPYSEASYVHSSGIHVSCLLKDPTSYCAVAPEIYGFEHTVVFDKYSGGANFKYYFGEKFTDDAYREMIDVVKEVSVEECKTFSFSEVENLLKERGFSL